MPPPVRPPRGFAALKLKNPKALRAIAALGGASVPAHLRSFSMDRDLAASAGAKGGANSRAGGRKKAGAASNV